MAKHIAYYQHDFQSRPERIGSGSHQDCVNAVHGMYRSMVKPSEDQDEIFDVITTTGFSGMLDRPLAPDEKVQEFFCDENGQRAYIESV